MCKLIFSIGASRKMFYIMFPYSDLSFLLRWSYNDTKCDEMNVFDEGIELSFRRQGDQLWTPLAFFTTVKEPRTSLDFRFDYDGGSNVTIRGFSVPVTVNKSDVQHHMKFRICSESLLGREIQFRWLQTENHNDPLRDTWSLDDVRVADCSGTVLFHDDFEENSIRYVCCCLMETSVDILSSTSSVNWPATRRAKVRNDAEICNDGRNGFAAWFGDYSEATPQSRMIATRSIFLPPTSVCRKSPCTTESVTTPSPSSPLLSTFF